MGNSSSSSSRTHQDESVDYGSLIPQGVYSGVRDWNQNVVSQLIIARRLAPFYRPLEDYEDSWDDDQILAARKDLNDSPENSENQTRPDTASIALSHSSSTKSKRSNTLKDPARPEAQVYRGAVECPICFLYYPPNINHSRCCDQAICTECFVQIKRAEPTTTHVVSEPAACPYCVQDKFGVVYTPPPWRAGLGSEGYHASWPDTRSPPESTNPPTHRRRQKSFGADSPEVVTTDLIRPDWEAKLEAVKAAVARRANRRIIMRQVGDRLIPVGVTSGRVHALSPEEAAAAAAVVENSGSSGRRSRRRRGDQPGAFEQFIGMGGQDLEELMLMEAMRLSLLEHEQQQRKEAEEKKKQEAAKPTGGDTPADHTPSETTSSAATPGPGPSTLEARSTSNLTSSSTSNLSVQGGTPASGSRSSSPSPRQNPPSTGSTPALPTHASSLSQDSLSTSASGSSNLQARSSFSLSRSRTPPPPPPNPVAAVGVPMSEANDAAWRARAGSPSAASGSKSKSALGTLSAAAALTSASVGAAVLGRSREGSREASRAATPEPTQSITTQPNTQSQVPEPLAPAIPSVMAPGTASIPMITVMSNDDATPLTNELADAMNEDTTQQNPFLAPGEDDEEEVVAQPTAKLQERSIVESA